MEKLVFLSLFFWLGLIPGILLSLLLELNKSVKGIAKYALFFPLSLGMLAVYAEWTTFLGFSIVDIKIYSLFIYLLILILIIKDRKKLFSKIINYFHLDKNDFKLLLFIFLLGLLSMTTLYFGYYKTTILPINDDGLIHQKIINKISLYKNITPISTTTAALDFFHPTSYPSGFHLIPALINQVKIFDFNNYKLVLKFSILLVLFFPLSLSVYYKFFAENKKQLVLALILSLGFGLFPYWTFGWSGYPLMLSISLFPITSIILVNFFKKEKLDKKLLFISSLLLSTVFITHVSETVIWIPLFILPFIFVKYIRLNKLFFTKLILLCSGSLFLSLPSVTYFLLGKYQNPNADIVHKEGKHVEKYIPLIMKFKSASNYYKFIFFNNSNYLLLATSISGLITWFLQKKKKKEVALFIFFLLFSLIFIDIFTFRVLNFAYNLFPWSSWERVAYIGVFIFPVFGSFIYKLIDCKNRKYFSIFLILVFILSYTPYKGSYFRARSTAKTITQIDFNDFLFFKWIKNNTPKESVFLNLAKKGKGESSQWLENIALRKLVFPYPSHLHKNYYKMLDDFDKAFVNYDDEKLKGLAFKYKFNYAIHTDQEQLSNKLPLVTSLANNHCFIQIYPDQNDNNCYAYADNNGGLYKSPDALKDYLFQYNSDCDYEENICLTKSDYFVNIGDKISNQQLIGSYYEPEKYKEGDFSWINNFVKIPFPKNKDLSNSIKIKYRSATGTPISVMSCNLDMIGSMNGSKDWVEETIKLTNKTKRKLSGCRYLILLDKTNKKIDKRHASFALDYIIYQEKI